MSKAPPFTMTNESITVVWEGKPVIVKQGSPNYLGLKKAITAQDWDDIKNHLTVSKSIESWANNKFTVNDGVVHYLGEAIPDDINARIIAMSGAGEDPTPLFNFWERLQKNPSFRSVKQLYGFLKNKNIPILEDGCFLAYKSVREDYKDVHSGTFDNHPGVTNEMPRNKISDDPNLACHEGLHIGALSYAQSFHEGGIIVVCKIDPENVVCVPYDYSQQKMRVCKYRVVGNYGTELPSTIFEEDLPIIDDEDTVDEEEDDLTDPGFSVPLKDMDELAETGLGVPLRDLKSTPARVSSKTSTPKTKAPKLNAKTKKLVISFNKLELDGLIEKSIEELRQYATYGVKLVGASKIPGGKVALVKSILKTRYKLKT
jgi:hypothetical protein